MYLCSHFCGGKNHIYASNSTHHCGHRPGVLRHKQSWSWPGGGETIDAMLLQATHRINRTPTLMRTATWPSITWHLRKHLFKQSMPYHLWSQKKNMCKVTTYTSQSRLCLKVLELGEPVKNARFEEIDIYQQPFFDPAWDSDKALKL